MAWRHVRYSDSDLRTYGLGHFLRTDHGVKSSVNEQSVAHALKPMGEGLRGLICQRDYSNYLLVQANA